MSLPEPRHERRPAAEHFRIGQLSLLVFGPGHGEAQIVILPDGSLGVIDGCLEPTRGDRSGRGDPVREFIDAWFERHPDQRIRFVALTHPHDDHYAGLGRLIEAYDSLIDKLWRSFFTDHWSSAYLKYRERTDPDPGGTPTKEDIKGLERVFKELQSRQPRIDVLSANKTMLLERFRNQEFSIECVAPSVNDIDHTQQELYKRIHDREHARSRFDPNLTSAALTVSWGQSKILLGGDLLCGQGHFEGWSSAARRVRGSFQVVKIAHHASEQAQDLTLLERIKPRLGIVTPFKYAGGNLPPRPEDIARLAAITSVVAITSPPSWLSAQNKLRPLGPRLPKPPAMPIRSSAFTPTADSPTSNDAVCVSLDAAGRITQLMLTGRARCYGT